jgi:GT2 family glycosyltransferase
MKACDLKTNSQLQPVTRLLAVIVIYKMHPRDSSTLQTLLDTAKNVCPEDLNLRILIWDNTPGGQDVGELPKEILYIAAPHNPGLARAYNQALELAQAECYDWLLTLDQDSMLPLSFLVRITGLVRELSPIETIGAIVPQVVSDGRIISPFRFLFGGVPKWFRQGVVGSKRAVYAVNSGATLRVSALREIGGYDPLFPLDVSDVSIFHCLHKSGKRVFIAGDLMINHNFAYFNKQGRMSFERYDASLLDDCAFWDMYMGPIARFERIIRLAGRACRDLYISEKSDFHKRTLSELKRRLLKPRHERIAEWIKWATLRRDTSIQASAEQPLQLEATTAQLPPLAKS